ncbi:MAG: alpha/beta hydrolase [Roseinatronobacter sp.]
MGWGVKIALLGLGGYGAIVLTLALAQSALIFPRGMVAAGPALPMAQALRLQTPDSVTLHGYQIDGTDPRAPVLLGFSGNATDAAVTALFLHQIAPAHGVVVYHYRGYGPSTGRPSARGLIADAQVIFDSLDAPQGVISVGFSIGSGIAADLAAARPLRGLVLVTPFDSLARVAQDTLPFVPVRLFFRHPVETLDALRGSTTPAHIFIATRDEVIPPARARALLDGLDRAGRAVTTHQIGTGHNDIYNSAKFQRTLRAALRGL